MGKKYDQPRYSWFRYMALKRGIEGNLLDLLWFDSISVSLLISYIVWSVIMRGGLVSSFFLWHNPSPKGTQIKTLHRPGKQDIPLP